MRTSGRTFWVADFETSTESWYQKDHVARVWLWAIYDIHTDMLQHGTDLDSFMDFVLRYRTPNPIIYFHNLKYDGSYIVNWLLSHNYEWVEDKMTDLGQFKTSISDMGLWYTIEVVVYKSKNTVFVLRFQDSLKKIPMTVAEIPKAFGFEHEDSKLKIDYDEYRPIGYQPTKEELDYVDEDVIIVAKALKQLEEEGFTKITGSADAFAHWKQTLVKDPKRVKNPEVTYRSLFPELPIEVDDFIRKAYKGGWTYLNPKFADKVITKKVEVWDINSMYPSKMVNKWLPIYEPVYFKGKPQPKKSQCYIVRCMMSFDLKEGYLPTIQIKHSGYFNPTDYLVSSEGMEIELTLTNIDLNLIFKHYDVHVYEPLDGYYFYKAKGMFDKHIFENMKVKEQSVGGKRYMAKSRMNQVYGKLATAPRKCSKMPILSNGVLCFELTDERIDKPQYTALSVFITAYARYDIITDAQKNYENFIYCDTDSLHMLAKENGSEPDLPIHQTHLGYYKLEHVVYKSLFLRSKTYIEQYENGDTEIKCAGASPEVKKGMTFDNFKVGGVYEGKLMPKQVVGGCILVKSTFTIK